MSTQTQTKRKPKKFYYEVISKNGQVIQDTVMAPDADTVKEELTQREYNVLSVQEMVNEGLSKDLNFNIGGKVRLKDLAAFSRKFSTMIDAGVPVSDCLAILADQTNNAKLKETTLEVAADINNGLRLGKSMSKYPDVFPDLMSNMVHAGEKSGTLDRTFKQIALNFEADVRLRGKIRSAMTYPVVVFVLAIILCTAMLLFIVPIFGDMFAQLGGELPLPTKVMVALSNFLKVGILPIVVCAGALGFWWHKNKKKESIRRIIDPLKLKIPVVGKLHQKVVIGRLARNLGNLLDSGVDIVSSLDIVMDTTGSTVISDALKNVREKVVEGAKLSVAMREEEAFPKDTVQMISVGENAADIEGMLMKIAESYEEEVENMTEALTSLMEPLMIVVLGAMVGSMVVSLYLPMFTIYQYIE